MVAYVRLAENTSERTDEKFRTECKKERATRKPEKTE
jgi:hypothetical protein